MYNKHYMIFKKAHIESLNEDELSMLWFIVNVVSPKIVNYELGPELITSINCDALKNRINQCEPFIKPESISVFNELKRKLESPHIIPPIVEVVMA